MDWKSPRTRGMSRGVLGNRGAVAAADEYSRRKVSVRGLYELEKSKVKVDQGPLAKLIV